MKILLLLPIFAIITLGIDPSSCDCSEYPILYEHDTYNGQCLELARNIGGFKNLDFNDKASSVCVPDGWKVTLYEHTNYSGNSLTIIGPYKNSDLKRNKPDGMNWGDKISSARVYKK